MPLYQEQKFYPIEIYGDITAIVGPKRCGKSLTATALIKRWLEVRRYRKVLSNMFFDFSSVGLENKFMALDDVDEIKKLKGRNVLFIDEMRRFVDSRMSSSMKNRLISNLLADTGKQKIDFIYTDQDYWAVDKRVRLNVDMILVPFYDILTGICYVRAFNSEAQYEDITFRDVMSSVPICFQFRGRPFFKFFNTEQKIEDYYLKFKPDNFLYDYLEWAKKQEIKKNRLKWIKLWNSLTGIGLGSDECSSLFNYIDLKKLI